VLVDVAIVICYLYTAQILKYNINSIYLATLLSKKKEISHKKRTPFNHVKGSFFLNTFSKEVFSDVEVCIQNPSKDSLPP
jgi:hypothetical protein